MAPNLPCKLSGVLHSADVCPQAQSNYYISVMNIWHRITPAFRARVAVAQVIFFFVQCDHKQAMVPLKVSFTLNNLKGSSDFILKINYLHLSFLLKS